MLLLLQGCMNEYESIKRQDALILEEELATRQTSDKLAARAAAEKEKKQRKKVSSDAYSMPVQHLAPEVQTVARAASRASSSPTLWQAFPRGLAALCRLLLRADMLCLLQSASGWASRGPLHAVGPQVTGQPSLSVI